MKMRKDLIPTTDPCGIWELKNMIGAKVKIKSVSGWNISGTADEDVLYTIEAIDFQINQDKLITAIVKLKEKAGKSYIFPDLEICQIAQNWEEEEKNEDRNGSRFDNISLTNPDDIKNLFE